MTALFETWIASPLWQFCAHLALLSATAVGGGMLTVMPDVHRYVVDNHHWITSEQFASAFALAQASPGPNFMYVSVLGWQIAGWGGALAASVAVVLPPGLVCFAVIRFGARSAGSRLTRAIRSGLLPLSAGLVTASAFVLAMTIDTNWRLGLMTASFALILLRTQVHPLWLIAAGGLAGGAGLL